VSGELSELNELKGLCRQLTEVHKEMRELGMFVHDRGLLECKACKLLEDIDVYGLLLVCRENTPGKAIEGYAFIPSHCGAEGLFICPGCGAEVLADLDV
jgi:hypothetical protein